MTSGLDLIFSWPLRRLLSDPITHQRLGRVVFSLTADAPLGSWPDRVRSVRPIHLECPRVETHTSPVTGTQQPFPGVLAAHCICRALCESKRGKGRTIINRSLDCHAQQCGRRYIPRDRA
jgi:hypothetical protein